MNDLRDLYREIILDHNRNPRNFGELADADRVVEGVNPLCGDRITLYVKLADGVVADVRFKGAGCAISMASSSLMTEKVKGAPMDEALVLFERVHAMLTGDARSGDAELESLDKLAALSGVREYPSRVKCASLGWHALKTAVTSTSPHVSTE
jgi:nitrogen fixation NifU-like protein